jgi:hypothetical protein
LSDSALTISIINSVVIVIATLFGKNYLTSYFAEKGKNLASKEDIHEITDKVEKIKSQYLLDLERVKSSLQAESAFLQKRRQIYEDIAGALRIFISGNPAGQQEKDKFLQAYATAWLWAPDAVLSTLNEFLRKQILYAQQPTAISQTDLKKLYAECVLEMRKDAGFSQTQVPPDQYQFLNFT